MKKQSKGYILVTGGAGFIGCNLADTLLGAGERVRVLDNLSRPGVYRNAEWLKERHHSRVEVQVGDVTDRETMEEAVSGARQVFHLAAQVAVTTSLACPREDLATNLLGTFNLLEAIRHSRHRPPLLFTSTNKVYGALEEIRVEQPGGKDSPYRYAGRRRGIDESQPLDFHSPYGCSKGAADQYVRDYARIYGLSTAVFRMSCIYGPRQLGTEDQGWVAHFARALLKGKPLTLYGDGHQVRDLLWVEDLIRAMRLALGRATPGQGDILNVGGGPGNAASLLQVLERLRELTGRSVPIRHDQWRPGDQRIYVSDTRQMERLLGWRAETPWSEGIARLVQALEEERDGWLESAEPTPLATASR